VPGPFRRVGSRESRARLRDRLVPHRALALPARMVSRGGRAPLVLVVAESLDDTRGDVGRRHGHRTRAAVADHRTGIADCFHHRRVRVHRAHRRRLATGGSRRETAARPGLSVAGVILLIVLAFGIGALVWWG